MQKNIAKDKSKTFALRIVRLYQYLTDNKKNLCYLNKFCGVGPV